MFLAILKLLEGLFALFMLALPLFSRTGVQAFSLSFFRLNIPDTPVVANVLNAIVYYSFFGLMAADGFGCFFLRVVRRGATPVQIAHVFAAVVSMIGFVLFCALILLLVLGIAALVGNPQLASVRVPIGGWILMGFFLALGFMQLLTTFGYHHSIARIMSHTRKELCGRRLLKPFFVSRLSGQCVRLIVYSGINVVLLVVLALVIASPGFTQALLDLVNAVDLSQAGISAGELKEQIINASTGVNVTGLVLLLLPSLYTILKTALVLGCSSDFNRCHV